MKLCHFNLLRYLLIIGCFWSGLANAQDVANLGPADLMGGISEDDVSIRFLSNLFGVVDGVLHGSGSQIFGAMFGVFNAAVLTLGTTILSYTLFVSTLRTAHEGEMLGRNWSSMWIPFKSASGFALLLPKASGYSIIQIFVMWTVVQGVSAANLVWDAALDYLNSGGAIIQPQTPTLAKSVIMAGNVLRSETCMFMLQEALIQDQAARNRTSGDVSSNPIPSFADSLTSVQAQPGNTGSSRTITFPGKLKNPDGSDFQSNNYVGICGRITWDAAATNATATTKQVDDARSLAVNQVITDLIPYAQQIAKDYGPFGADAKQTALTTMSKTVLKDAANDYEGIIGPAVNLMASDRSALTGFISEAKKEGWIMAGSYYKNLIDLNRAYAASENAYPTATVSFTPDASISLPASIKEQQASLQTFFTSDSSLLGQYIQAQVSQGGGSIGQAKVDRMAAFEREKTAAEAFDWLLGLPSIIQGFVTLGEQTGKADSLNVVSPVSAAAILGGGLLNFAVMAWVLGTGVAFTMSAIGGVCSAVNPIGNAILTMFLWVVPMMTAILILCIAVGSTLCFYLPMVPYILFLFGGIGWLIGVIESIAAAPLVALGIAYPEGHELLGKADPAVMLLTNIFIRPSLMVIGFIGGISLSYVGVWLLNAGFSRAYQGMVSTVPKGMAFIFAGLAILSIYTALIVQVINQAFGLIHVIPDEVLRWVGGGGRQFGEAQGEQAVRGGVKGDIDQTAKGGAETTGGAFGAKDRREPPDKLEVGKGGGKTTGAGPGGGGAGGAGGV